MKKWIVGTLLLNLVFLSLGGLITLGIISAQFDRLKPLIEQTGYAQCEADIARAMNSGKNRSVGMFLLTKTVLGTQEHYNIDLASDWRNE